MKIYPNIYVTDSGILISDNSKQSENAYNFIVVTLSGIITYLIVDLYLYLYIYSYISVTPQGIVKILFSIN